MRITLNDIGKRYNKEWIFRHLHYKFTPDNAYVILGANGSGKSTLLQVIAGNFLPSEGSIDYWQDSDLKTNDSGLRAKDALPATLNATHGSIAVENIFQYLSFASPYLELLEEYTLLESIRFHAKFKNFYPGLSVEKIISICELEKSKDKEIKYFSSGMKQRVRLALAILCDTPLLLLDEPASNLDAKGIEWYQKLTNDFSKNRLVIVCSNEQKQEYEYCNRELKIEEYK